MPENAGQMTYEEGLALFEILKDGTALPIPVQKEYDEINDVTTYRWTRLGVASKSASCERVDIDMSLSFPGTTWQPGETGTITGTQICPLDATNTTWTLSSTPATEFTGTRTGVMSFTQDVTPAANGQYLFQLTNNNSTFTGGASMRTNLLVAQVGSSGGGDAPVVSNHTIPDVLSGSTIDIDLEPYASDTETPSASLIYRIANLPSFGALSEHTDDNGQLKYTAPGNDFSGTDAFTWFVSDGDNISGTATITVVITRGVVRVLNITMVPVTSSLVPGQSTTLNGTVDNADACTPTGNTHWVTWFTSNVTPDRDNPVPYSYETEVLNDTATYGLTCTLGTDQSMTVTATVTVTRTPSMSFVPSESSILNGQTVDFTLTVVYGESCTATGPTHFTNWVSAFVLDRNGSVTGTYTSEVLSADQVYTITCTSGGVALPTVSVTISVDGLQITANAGGPYATTLPDQTIPLSGGYTVVNPPATISATYLWEKVSGPGTVVFSDASLPMPNATFSLAGTYRVSLKVTIDGVTSSPSEAVVIINPANLQNRPPQGTMLWDSTAQVGEAWVVGGTFTDPDLDDLSLVEGSNNPAGLTFTFVESSPDVWTLTITWMPTLSGVYDISWSVIDEHGLPVSFRYTVNVGGATLAAGCDYTTDQPTVTSHTWTVTGGSCGDFDEVRISGDPPADLTVHIGVIDRRVIITGSYAKVKIYRFAVELYKGDGLVGRFGFDQQVASMVATEDEVVDEAVPEGFTLLGNYPNPFNPTTTILFHLAEPGAVQLVVVDMLGREVYRDKLDFGTGEHKWQFDATKLPTGEYLYRIASKSGALTGSMTLVK